MTTTKQREAAQRNVKKAQSGAKRKQTLKNMPKSTRTALGKESAAVQRGDEPTPPARFLRRPDRGLHPSSSVYTAVRFR
jgi:hypothetical protein